LGSKLSPRQGQHLHQLHQHCLRHQGHHVDHHCRLRQGHNDLRQRLCTCLHTFSRQPFKHANRPSFRLEQIHSFVRSAPTNQCLWWHCHYQLRQRLSHLHIHLHSFRQQAQEDVFYRPHFSCSHRAFPPVATFRGHGSPCHSCSWLRVRGRRQLQRRQRRQGQAISRLLHRRHGLCWLKARHHHLQRHLHSLCRGRCCLHAISMIAHL